MGRNLIEGVQDFKLGGGGRGGVRRGGGERRGGEIRQMFRYDVVRRA